MLLAVISVQYDDLTYDEQDHYNYGVQVLKGNGHKPQPGFDFNTTMPVSAFNALPRAVQQLLDPELTKNDFGVSDTKTGRYITILFSLLLLGYIYAFAHALAGPLAGNIAIALAAVDPNLLAHGRLVTTDLYSALAFTATLYHLYCWTFQQERNHFLWWTISLAIAQCCKINAILLYPISFLILTESAYRFRQMLSIRSILIGTGVFLLVQVVIINSFFQFEGVGTSLEDYTFRSTFFTTLQHGFLGGIPIPLPTTYVQTFDLTQFERETFTGTAQNYLLGELRYKEGFWNYYLICFIVKTPLLLQLTMLAAFIWAIRKKAFNRTVILFLLLPSLVTLLLLSRSEVQNGYRYLLPVLALILIFIGAFLAKCAWSFQWKQWLPLGILYMLPLLWQSGNYIAYTSEWLWPKHQAWKFVADSNLNWGQRDKRIKKYLKEHPEIISEPDSPVHGKVLIDINQYTGIVETERYQWLRERYQPVEVIEGCFLLFDIP